MDRPTRFGSVLLLRWKSLVSGWRDSIRCVEQDISRCHYESVFTLARVDTGTKQDRSCTWIKERLSGIKRG